MSEWCGLPLPLLFVFTLLAYLDLSAMFDPHILKSFKCGLDGVPLVLGIEGISIPRMRKGGREGGREGRREKMRRR